MVPSLAAVHSFEQGRCGRLFRYPLVTPLARKRMLSRNLEPLSGQQLAKGSSNVPVDGNAFNYR
jgi:hypothetical protein